jgi:hypothetical protein
MMSLLDGFSGYNHICVKRIDKYKTTFSTHLGTFTYEEIPFSLINACATFQRDMQIAFDNIIGKIIQIYLDDLTFYSKNQEHHFDHLKQVFLLYIKSGMTLNPTKYIFSVTARKLSDILYLTQ